MSRTAVTGILFAAALTSPAAAVDPRLSPAPPG